MIASPGRGWRISSGTRGNRAIVCVPRFAAGSTLQPARTAKATRVSLFLRAYLDEANPILNDACYSVSYYVIILRLLRHQPSVINQGVQQVVVNRGRAHAPAAFALALPLTHRTVRCRAA